MCWPSSSNLLRTRSSWGKEDCDDPDDVDNVDDVNVDDDPGDAKGNVDDVKEVESVATL